LRAFQRFPLAFAGCFMIKGHPMTKQDLVENIRAKCNLQRKEAEVIMTSVLDIIKESLASGEEVKLSGFGKFVIQQKNDRTGRNPQTGEPLTITARKILTFKPSTLLKQEINGE
jgi:integration host factor subunit alpha